MRLINFIIMVVFVTSSLLADNFDTSFNYFGNLTASSLNKDKFYIKGYQVDDVQDYFELSTYSKLGLQTMIYNDKFTFVAQAVTHYVDDSLNLDLTWLNAKYKINHDFSIRAGRIQSAMFLNSDVRDVDYVNTWAIEPNAFYTMLPMRYYDGLEISYEKVIEDYYINITIAPYGKVTADIDDMVSGSTLDVSDMHMVSLVISNNDFKFKTSYAQVNMDIPIYDVNYHNTIETLEDEGNDMSKYNYIDKKISFLTLGLEYNYENYSFLTEIAKRDSVSLLPDTIAYYTMLSYRYDKFIPFIMYSSNNNDSSHFDTSNITDITNSAKIELEKILYQTNDSQKTFSIGFRYDLKTGIALKFQVDKIVIKNYGTDYSDIIKRLGYTQIDAGVKDDNVYQTTIGLSFAF
ncbi:MAG: hypothetical protein ABGW74_05635 [Campylobacterales bacterium]